MFSPKEPPIVISVGGSLIVPNGGPDTVFLEKLNKFIRDNVAKGKRFFLVAGGGKTARHYRDAGGAVVGGMSDNDLDWLGIHATRLNAHLLRTIFQDIAHPRIIENYDKKLTNWKEPVVIGAGWKPGWSTDYDAVILARDYGAKMMINLSDIDWVYDKDPSKFKDAKPVKKLTWDEMTKLVGTKWKPGINMPFDPIAAKLGRTLNLTVIITNGKKFDNLENILEGNEFKGTVILPHKVDADYFDEMYYSGKKGEYRVGLVGSIIGKVVHAVNNFYRALMIKISLNPQTCLDVGCGTGQLVKYLRSLGIDAYGVELSSYALALADNSIKHYLKKGDIFKLPYKNNQFDLVLSVDVLEHLEAPKIKQAIGETIRVSKKYILHKIYTRENIWITLFHNEDFSHFSVFTKKRWLKIFSSLKNISILRGSFIKLPSFLETVYLLKKK
jgi:uridylate kinase